ncbi:ABC transporter substrate-binding protein [Dongia mobilis]|jgi:NitT/TauT family transport system substrate-binding protein|uniref:ABC transporter substrate-binding protein n=1 Tax=Dongia sp. TaxID=1977262 RepID=UPI0026EB26FA
MNWTPNRRQVLQAGAATLAMSGLVKTAIAQAIPTTPEAGAIKMAIEPWLGYGQWHIAAKKGLFAAAGLADVEVINFNTDADLNAALAAGQVQCGNIATHTAMAFAAAGLPIKIVALLDVSMTADAMITDGSIASVADLKGKQVAFEEGTTSHILLNYALAQNGMTLDDVQKVPMPASDAGSALIAGKVPVAVTYEPYLTLAMQQNPKVKMLYSAGENPGLISDVFVVREDFLAEKPGQVLALLRAWEASVADYKADTAGGRAIISEAVGAKPEELATAFDGVTYYTIAENKTQLTGDFVNKVVPEVKKAALSAGLLSADVDLAKLIDTRFVEAF